MIDLHREAKMKIYDLFGEEIIKDKIEGKDISTATYPWWQMRTATEAQMLSQAGLEGIRTAMQEQLFSQA